MKRTLFLLIFTIIQHGFIYATIYKTTAPSWIKKQPIPLLASIDTNDISEGYYYLNSETQINLFTRTYYHHYAYKIVSETGVQNISRIDLEYDPLYEKLTLHNIKIHRNGKEISILPNCKIEETRRVSDVESQIYDDDYSVFIFLADVRAGDIVEYDYSIEGDNPLFKDAFSYKFYYNYSQVLPSLYVRLIKPIEKTLYYKSFNGQLAASISQENNIEEWIWDYKNLPKKTQEKHTPNWYDPYGFIQITSYKDWNEVEKWAESMFTLKEPICVEIIQEINSIKLKNTTKDAQLLAAVRFVQDKIRYLGIEVGENTHRPFSPNKVFKQRYGDCKDKSFLLVQMLKLLNIEAHVALVNSNLHEHIKDYLPTTSVFNHVIVQVKYDGKTLWFDATEHNKRGDLKNYYMYNPGAALCIDGVYNGLTTIFLTSNKISSVNIKETFTIHNINGEASLNVITTYKGSDADYTRASFAENSLSSLEKNYLSFYNRAYENVSVSNKLSYVDNDIENEFKVFESYKIGNIWNDDDTATEGKKDALFYAHIIKSKIDFYDDYKSKRKDPLVLSYPENIDHTVVINLPEEWNIEDESGSMDNAFFHFSYAQKYSDNVLVTTYHFETKKAVIDTSETTDFLNKVAKLYDDYIYFSLTYNANSEELDSTKKNTNTSSKTNWLALAFFGLVNIFALILLLSFLYFILRKKADVAITGLNSAGWIVLPFIGIFALFFHFVYELWNPLLFSLSAFNTIQKNIFETWLYIFYLGITPIILWASITTLLVGIFRLKSFPIYYTAYSIVQFVVWGTLLIAATENDYFEEYGISYLGICFQLFYTTISLVLWVPILNISKKVHDFFNR